VPLGVDEEEVDFVLDDVVQAGDLDLLVAGGVEPRLPRPVRRPCASGTTKSSPSRSATP
jgi:hypothetical protein